MFKSALGVLFCLTCLTPQTAQAQVALKYAPKYTAGAAITHEVNIQSNQTLTIAGMPLETKAENFVVVKEQVESAAADGSAVVNGGIDTMQLDLSLPGGLSYQFNSSNPAATQSPVPELDEVTKFLTEFCKSRWTCDVGSNGHIRNLKYTDDLLSKIPEKMQGEASPEKMMRQTNQGIDRLPGKETQVGDSWERQETLELDGGQSFRMQKKFTYKGVEDHGGKKLHRIDVETGKIEYEAAQPIGPLEVKGSDIKIDSSQGTLWYDVELGRVVESTETMHVVGDIQFSVMGNELPGELDLTLTTTEKVH